MGWRGPGVAQGGEGGSGRGAARADEGRRRPRDGAGAGQRHGSRDGNDGKPSAHANFG
eukprot:SAG31_NODE_3893_length_3774_cov_5.674558_1_plen_58_part_00